MALLSLLHKLGLEFPLLLLGDEHDATFSHVFPRPKEGDSSVILGKILQELGL